MRRLSCIFATLLFSALAGCATTSVEASKVEGYSETVDQLYVQTRFSEASKREEQGVDAEFRYRFQIIEQDITVASRRVVLDDDSTSQELPVPFEAAGTETSHILIVQEVTRSETRRNTRLNPLTNNWESGMNRDDFTIDASLYDTASRERVWQAEIWHMTDKSSREVEDEGREMARTVYNKLAEDGLVPVIPNL